MLLAARDMTAVLAGHKAFFLADLVVLLVQRSRLAMADLALAHFVVDAAVLVGPAAVVPCTGRVGLVPSGGGCGAAVAGQRNRGDDQHEGFAHGHGGSPWT